jgi:hypothetical protein
MVFHAEMPNHVFWEGTMHGVSCRRVKSYMSPTGGMLSLSLVRSSSHVCSYWIKGRAMLIKNKEVWDVRASIIVSSGIRLAICHEPVK